MNEHFPIFLHEVNIVPLNGFYFRLPDCEFDRDDINVYVEWFDLNDGGNYGVRVYATISTRDNSRFQVDSFTVTEEDISQGYERIIQMINESDDFVESVGKLLKLIGT